MPGRIRLFIFIHDLAPFGAQRVSLEIIKNVDRKVFSVTVCSFGNDETLGPQIAACGAQLVLLKARRFLDLSAWLRLARTLFRLRPDIVQTNLPELSVPVRLCALLIPGVHVLHAVHNPISSEPWHWRFLNRATLRLCAAVVFVSESAKQEARLKSKRLQARAFAIPNGVALETASAERGTSLRKELGIGEDEKVIACVARLEKQKGQDLLIEAAAQLTKEKRPLRVMLAGDGETSGELMAQAGRCGIAGKVLFLGRRSDIARILSASDVYAAPSRWEGFGLALGEAMLAGKPCVASRIPGHMDILKDGVTGVAVPPQDPAALAAGIAKVLDEREFARMLSASAMEWIRSRFSMEVMAKKYEQLYIELASSEKR